MTPIFFLPFFSSFSPPPPPPSISELSNTGEYSVLSCVVSLPAVGSILPPSNWIDLPVLLVQYLLHYNFIRCWRKPRKVSFGLKPSQIPSHSFSSKSASTAGVNIPLKVQKTQGEIDVESYENTAFIGVLMVD